VALVAVQAKETTTTTLVTAQAKETTTTALVTAQEKQKEINNDGEFSGIESL
jgi:hypothetical protein